MAYWLLVLLVLPVASVALLVGFDEVGVSPVVATLATVACDGVIVAYERALRRFHVRLVRRLRQWTGSQPELPAPALSR